MRVALLSPLFESVPPRLYGGTERVVHGLCKGLTDANIEVTLFASGDSSAEGKIVPVIEEALRLRQKPLFDPQALNFKFLAMVAERAREFDVIHNHHDYWMLPLSEMLRIPVLTTLHGRLDVAELKPVFCGFPRARFVAISDSQRSGLPQARWVRTLHHGIDVDNFRFTEKTGKYLAFLGRISEDKRPEWAIEIAKKSGVPLKIAAKIEGRASREYFESKIRAHIDGNFIEYVGEISELEKSRFLGEALAMVFPVDWPEPFGLVILESLACGTPVLARPFGAVPEITRDGVTGFVHASVSELARRKDVSALDRRRCRQWVEEKFSLRRMTEDYIDVYRNLVSEFKTAEGGRIREPSDSKSEFNHSRRDFLYPVQRAADRDS